MCKVCECISTVYTCINSWKEPFNTYNSSTWIFSLFWLLNWFSGLLSIGHYRSFLSAAAILFILIRQKSSSSYERIKNKHETVLLSNQKAWKQYTLNLQELLNRKITKKKSDSIFSFALTFHPSYQYTFYIWFFSHKPMDWNQTWQTYILSDLQYFIWSLLHLEIQNIC